MEKKRCHWVTNTFDQYIRYHDEEWGVPVHEDRVHFEFLVLESAQAGLSWSTILKKRDGYRQAFAGFDPKKVAAFAPEKVEELLENAAIIRNRTKIAATINNAARFLEVQAEFGSFDKYIWQFVDNQVKVGHWEDSRQVPATTPESDRLAKDLKEEGLNF